MANDMSENYSKILRRFLINFKSFWTSKLSHSFQINPTNQSLGLWSQQNPAHVTPTHLKLPTQFCVFIFFFFPSQIFRPSLASDPFMVRWSHLWLSRCTQFMKSSEQQLDNWRRRELCSMDTKQSKLIYISICRNAFIRQSTHILRKKNSLIAVVTSLSEEDMRRMIKKRP